MESFFFFAHSVRMLTRGPLYVVIIIHRHNIIVLRVAKLVDDQQAGLSRYGDVFWKKSDSVTLVFL